jgi:hypothetical protein
MTFPSVEGEKTWYTDDQKWTLDLLHFAKIEDSVGVVMLNVNGYLGESSSRELRWARIRGKRVFWLWENDDRRLGSEPWLGELIGLDAIETILEKVEGL